MPAASGGILAGAFIILIGAAPFLFDHALRGAAPPWLADTAAAIQLTAIALLVTVTWRPRYRVSLAVGLLAIMIMTLNLSDLPPRAIGLAISGGCHAAAYCSLLIWFWRSLRSDREPVVTGLARRMRRTMPAKVVRYTRQVTIAWCLFFAAQLFVSVGLLLFAPGAVWSAFVNLLNVPLLGAMVVSEFGCRLILFRHEPHTSLIDTLRALRHVRVTSIDQP